MADQDREVDDPNGTLARERPRPGVGVIDDVREEKEARRGKRRNHRGAVAFDLPAQDEVVAGEQEQPGDAVQCRVQGR